MSPLYSAVQDFRHARRRADLEQIIGRLRGEPTDLLPFDEVRKKLKITSTTNRTLKDIPLDAIVGSVGRYADFTRSFLPKQDSDASRWTMVMMTATDHAGFAPIEAYQIGEVYFVADGNHRVSVARELNASTIQAFVTELKTKIPLTPDIQPDDLILKAEYAEFLINTNLDKLRPKADLSISVPGGYQIIEEHITVHRYFMGIDYKRDISPDEAASHWHDKVYLPVIRAIRNRGVLHDFPGRTETDLYLWVSEHRAILQTEFGMEIPTAAAVADLAAISREKARKLFTRLREKLLNILLPWELDAGPEPGEWRREHLADRRDDTLFMDILVPVSGLKDEWNGLECALEIARREDAQLFGLYIKQGDKSDNKSSPTETQLYFEERCVEAGGNGKFTVQKGQIAQQICSRARWVDIVMLNLAHPPSTARLSRLSSGFRTIIRRCSRPIIAVPNRKKFEKPEFTRALLAYGGNPKSDEALFVAVYLTVKWGLSLDVITVTTTKDDNRRRLQERAETYLREHKVEANFFSKSGRIDENIILVAELQQSDIIIMGGYEANPLVEIFMGSNVDGVLRRTNIPVLICR